MARQVTPAFQPDLISALAEMLGVDMNMVRRVVIDIERASMVIAHVEMFADASVIKVVQSLNGVEIVREPKPESSEGEVEHVEDERSGLDDVQRR